MAPVLYEAKKFVLRPRTAWRRRRETSNDFMARVMLEAHYFRTPMYDFFAATAENPDLLVDVDLPPAPVLFDVGAYTGEWTAPALARHPDATVYAFEPEPEALAQYRQAHGDDGRVRVHPYGLADRDFHTAMAMDGPGSSIYADDGHYGTADRVEIRDVIGVLDELAVDHIDLMKMNIEGAEYDLLDRLLDTGRIESIDWLLIQFHEWHPGAYRRRRRIRRRLTATHREVWDHNFVFELWGPARLARPGA